MLDLSWHNIVHSNTLNFLLLAGVLVYFFAGKVSQAIETITTNIRKLVNDSLLNKKTALDELESAKEDYKKTPEETQRIKDIAQKTLKSLKEQATIDKEAQKQNIYQNADKIISTEKSKIVSNLTKETAENSVNLALNNIQKKLAEDENLHDKLIEKAIQELEII